MIFENPKNRFMKNHKVHKNLWLKTNHILKIKNQNYEKTKNVIHLFDDVIPSYFL